MFPTWTDWDIQYTRKGLLKKSAFTLLKTLALIAFILGVVKQKQNGLLPKTRAYVRRVGRTVLFSGAGLLQAAAKKL